MKSKIFTICIPSYNRSSLLSSLLDSIFAQSFNKFEVLICEDCSPERNDILKVVQKYTLNYPGKIRYYENEINLGYDGNIRRLVELAEGEYCLFMGNDDLLCPGALQIIADSIKANQACGVVVRSYASFEKDPTIFKQIFRYFPGRKTLAAGAVAISTAYRRSVVISGMVISRDAAHAVHNDQFDGTLLYQLYLVGMVLARHSVVFVPNIIALRRDGTPPDFGNSAVERNKFVPHDQTPESSVHFVQGMLDIASYVERKTGYKIFESIRRDIGNYAYPILAIQAKRPLKVFFQYVLDLAKLGLWRYPLFHFYFLTLLILGPDRSDVVINRIKRRLGYTPRFGVAGK